MAEALFIPRELGRRLLAEEFAEQPLTIEDLCDQVLTRVQIVDAVLGPRALTPRRVLREILAITALRSRNNLPPYPETVIHAVTWLLARS